MFEAPVDWFRYLFLHSSEQKKNSSCLFSSLIARRESIYMPHTGSFTMCSELSAGPPFGRTFLGPPRNTASRRRKIQTMNIAEKIRTRIESIWTSDELSDRLLQFVDLLFKFGFPGKIRVCAQKILPNTDSLFCVVFCVDEDDSFVEQRLREAGAIGQHSV